MAIARLKNVSKTYPLGTTTVHALNNVSLAVKRGSFTALMGPSGSGKTTLLNMLGCIDRPTTGQVVINDRDVSSLSDNEMTRLRLFHIGFIFQSFHLIPVLTVLENVEFPLLLMKKYPESDIRKRAMEIIEQVQISDQMNQRPSELSGGQRQRVAIARALVTNPELVLADEPTANLDSETGKLILSLMKSLNQKNQTTFFFSTHDTEILKFADTKLTIKDGKIEE